MKMALTVLEAKVQFNPQLVAMARERRRFCNSSWLSTWLAPIRDTMDRVPLRSGFLSGRIKCVLAASLLGVSSFAAPTKVFLGGGEIVSEAPLRYWGGDAVALQILSHRPLPEPEVHVLAKALTAPLRLEGMDYQASKLEEGLYSHIVSFTAPEPREQQRYLLKFGPEGMNLLFDVYPAWLREQVARKAAAYKIQIEPKHSGAGEFFAQFESENPEPQKRPTLKIVHSEHELVIRQSPQKIVWKTNCDALDAADPSHVLRFEALLDTLRTIT